VSQTDDYGRHEVLHMASFLEGVVDEELLKHDVVRAEPEWLALAEAARKALADLYLAIGARHLPEEPEVSAPQTVDEKAVKEMAELLFDTYRRETHPDLSPRLWHQIPREMRSGWCAAAAFVLASTEPKEAVR
jgi:hypothetical protein